MAEGDILKVCLYCARYDYEPLTITPLGIGYIASYLVQQGIVNQEQIRIVDTLNEAIEFKPDILGDTHLNTNTGNFVHYEELNLSLKNSSEKSFMALKASLTKLSLYFLG